MKLRSLLFVPGDRPERFDKAVASGADALILDLEDSVSDEKKPFGRSAITDWLAKPRGLPAFVRINPLDGDYARDDIAALAGARPDGFVLPKAEGSASVKRLLSWLEGRHTPPILPIATETPAAIFQLGSYSEVGSALAGLTWGAEDLPASIGATSAREGDGRYTAPIEMARSLTLFGAHAAGVAAIETVFPRIDAPDALAAYVARARRDGFSGMMAIHPAQVAIINSGFTPSEDEIAQARRVVAAFADKPGAGALKMDGKMIDRPHLIQAQRILQQA